MKQYDSELLCVKHYVNQSYFVQNCVNRSLNESSVFLTCVSMRSCAECFFNFDGLVSISINGG